ncbi:MAG: hypothetical protein ABIO85_05990 [Sphingomicrobium sp.]
MRRSLVLLILLFAACDRKSPIVERATPVNAAITIGSPVEPVEDLGKPGSPGGLPDDRTPLAEPRGPIDPKSAEGAGQVVQLYMALIGERKFAEAQKAWREGIDQGPLAPVRLEALREVHGEVGKPFDQEGAAGSSFIHVPVRVFGKGEDGRPFNLIGTLTLRRVNDVDGSSAEQRRWHIVESALASR